MAVPLKYIKGTGNVYEDLGFKDSEERIAKARLAFRISQIIDKRQLRQEKAGEILGINQPKISALVNGNLSGFSIERLINYLIKLDQDVEIVIRPHKPKKSSQHFSVTYVDA